jgi:hypothetical protein
MIQQPVAVGLAICEQVIVEEGTRNVTLVNCFNILRLRELPSVASRLVVHAALTDGLGDGRVSLVVNRLDTFEEIYARHARVSFTNPLQEVRLLFRPRKCSFPVPGWYQASLLVDGEFVAQQAFRVLVAEGKV